MSKRPNTNTTKSISVVGSSPSFGLTQHRFGTAKTFRQLPKEALYPQEHRDLMLSLIAQLKEALDAKYGSNAVT